jgi:hypothetical protein
MRIGDESNRPRVADYVQGFHVHADHYRYGAKCSIWWKSGVDSESSEVYGYQKVGPYIPNRAIEHDHCNIILIDKVGS